MKFSSDPKILLFTLENVVSDNNEMSEILRKKNEEHFDTYLDTFLFSEVFCDYHNNKRSKFREMQLWESIQERTVQVHNPQYSFWKDLISMLPFTKDYNIPGLVETIINIEAVEEDKLKLIHREASINMDVRSLNSEWKEFKKAIRNKTNIKDMFYSGCRKYHFRIPPTLFENITNELNMNTNITKSFIDRIKIAMKVESINVELSDTDIKDLETIINYSNSVRDVL